MFIEHECTISVVFELLISSVEEVPRFRSETSKNRDHAFSELMNRGGNDRGDRRERRKESLETEKEKKY
jgi:hypothetical protein